MAIEGAEVTVEVAIVAARWRDPQGGRAAILIAELPDGDQVTVMGKIGHLAEGHHARITGRWTGHRAWGWQIQAQAAEPLDPAGTAEQHAYLVKHIRHIGRSRADAPLARFDGDAFAAIDRDPEAAFSALPGMNANRVAQAVADWKERRALLPLYALLAPLGFDRLAEKIIDR